MRVDVLEDFAPLASRATPRVQSSCPLLAVPTLAELVLRNNGAGDLPISADGRYVVAASVGSGADYDVTVATQPTSPGQTCTVTNGKSKVAGANVVVDVVCTANTYKVGGKLEGLQGNGLVLQNNAGDDLTLNAANNGDFAFVTKVASGAAYAVTVKTQQNGLDGESCWATTGSGTMADADVRRVRVWCSTHRKVFITSQLFGANLGGLDGADAKCQALADAADVKGVYRAWLSDTTGSPTTRFTRSTIPYRLVNGTTIANDWSDLVNGSIAAPISVTETGGAPPASTSPRCDANDVFSNTTAAGTLQSTAGGCTNWTGVGMTMQWGFSFSKSAGWSSVCVSTSSSLCDGTHKSKLYCFRQ
jgi:hypothetical protein